MMMTSRAATCAALFAALLVPGAAAITPLHSRMFHRSLPLVSSALRAFQASLLLPHFRAWSVLYLSFVRTSPPACCKTCVAEYELAP